MSNGDRGSVAKVLLNQKNGKLIQETFLSFALYLEFCWVGQNYMRLWEENHKFILADPENLWESAGELCVCCSEKVKSPDILVKGLPAAWGSLVGELPQGRFLILPVAHPSPDGGTTTGLSLDSSLASATSYCVSLGKLQPVFESVSLTVT